MVYDDGGKTQMTSFSHQVKSTYEGLARFRRERLILMACWQWQSICALDRCVAVRRR
jgi:hypothetical protein